MDYISDFYTNVHKSIREAQKYVHFFTTDEKILSHTIGSFWNRTTLLDEMVQYTKKWDVFLDVIGDLDTEKFEKYFKKTSHVLNVQYVPNSTFTKPLTDLTDAFIIIDRQTAYILPDKRQSGGLKTTQKEEVADLSTVFNQLLQRGQDLWRSRYNSSYGENTQKNLEKVIDKVIDIKNLSQMMNSQCIASNNIVKNIQLSQQLRRER